MSFFGLNFGQSADIDIILDNQDERKMAEIRDENGRKERHYLYFDGESVNGKVNVTLHRKTNRLEHQGIKIEFIGQIELYHGDSNQFLNNRVVQPQHINNEFLNLVKELARPGCLTESTSFNFEFKHVEKPYETIRGLKFRLRYFLRVTIVRRLTDMTKEMDLLVHTLSTFPEMNNPIKMEVGIEECLHIEFEYNKSKYHLKDVIVGKIYFLLVRIKIKHMEVGIIKRETTGWGPNTFHDNETIAKYQIMDGAPVKGESIPIRVFLAGYDLTPTMRDINKKFSVKYYINLVLIDEEERRYYKQQEIILWRKRDEATKIMHCSTTHPPGVMHGACQVPQALARHNPEDRPTHNVRAAPTPTAEGSPIGTGAAPPSQAAEDSQYPIGKSTQQGPMSGGHKVNQEKNSPIPKKNEDSDNNEISEIEQISSEMTKSIYPWSEPPSWWKSEKYSEPPDTYVNEEKTANIKTEEPKSLPVASKTSSQNELGVDKSKEEQTISVPTNVTPANDITKAANDTTLERELDDDGDSKPRPPEDDSVPDMEDSFTGDRVGLDEVDERINKVKIDEDGSMSSFELL